ncbi:MAG: cytidine deaminase [Bacteroidetes bacterium]|nr:cytidine deaminase [Bacteroidota bacterium]
MSDRLTHQCTLHQSHMGLLVPGDNRLCQEAMEAANSAYAPYSKFFVGAAVRLRSGVVVRGANQENAAYPSGLCAERVALFAAGAQHHGHPIACLAIYSPSLADPLALPLPCGGCRQVIHETERHQQSDIKILLVTKDHTVYIAHNSQVFLPFPFVLP